MKKSILTIIINLKFDVINLYKFISSKDIILFNLNLEIVIYKELLIEIDEIISFIIMMSKIEKILFSFVY